MPEDYSRARHLLVEGLRGKGIKDSRVLAAMERVPREAFVPAQYRRFAYEDTALPIGEEQTISQPFVVALMMEALQLRGHEKVLEIGTGSGYQTALLAELAAWVSSVERLPSLAGTAARLLQRMGYTSVDIHVADGTLGWPSEAPYQGIVVTAAASEIPGPLLTQLADGGRLVIPVGPHYAQSLVLVTKQKGRLAHRDLGPVRFVPLIGRFGWQEGRNSHGEQER